MKSGKTLWETLCDNYYTGTGYVDSMIIRWNSIGKCIDPEIYTHMKAKLSQQKTDAEKWRETCINYFQNYSKEPVRQKQPE